MLSIFVSAAMGGFIVVSVIALLLHGRREEERRKIRAAHVAWCKERARPYLEAGQMVAAVNSFMADLEANELTKGEAESLLMLNLIDLSSVEAAKKIIEEYT